MIDILMIPRPTAQRHPSLPPDQPIPSWVVDATNERRRTIAEAFSDLIGGEIPMQGRLSAGESQWMVWIYKSGSVSTDLLQLMLASLEIDAAQLVQAGTPVSLSADYAALDRTFATVATGERHSEVGVLS